MRGCSHLGFLIGPKLLLLFQLLFLSSLLLVLLALLFLFGLLACLLLDFALAALLDRLLSLRGQEGLPLLWSHVGHWVNMLPHLSWFLRLLVRGVCVIYYSLTTLLCRVDVCCWLHDEISLINFWSLASSVMILPIIISPIIFVSLIILLSTELTDYDLQALS